MVKCPKKYYFSISLFFVAGVKPLFGYSVSVASRVVQTKPCKRDAYSKLRVFRARSDNVILCIFAHLFMMIQKNKVAINQL